MIVKHAWKTWGHIALALAVLGLLIVSLATPVWAADFRGGENVIINADEVIDDDVFVMGNRVEINGTIKGDLFAVGQEVIVNGNVEGSQFLAGQTLTANGQVAGSIYAGGYALTMGPAAAAGRNVYFGGFSLTTEAGSNVGRSLYAGGYQTIHNGEVAHDLVVGNAALELNGTVHGDVRGEVGDSEQGALPFQPSFPGAVPAVPPGLRMGDDAQVGGDVDVVITAGEQQVDRRTRGRAAFGLGRAVANRIGEFITLLIVGGLLLYFGPDIVQRASGEAQERPLPSAGFGCLITLLFPLAALLAVVILIILALIGGLVTFGNLSGDILGIGGAGVSLAIATFVLIFSLVTKAIVAFLGGRLLWTRLVPQVQPGWWADFGALALGALIYEILRAMIVILVGLGAIYLTLREWIRASRVEPAPAAGAPS
jgi:cytoskeletal protein CcmA (bactofilin family)